MHRRRARQPGARPPGLHVLANPVPFPESVAGAADSGNVARRVRDSGPQKHGPPTAPTQSGVGYGECVLRGGTEKTQHAFDGCFAVERAAHHPDDPAGPAEVRPRAEEIPVGRGQRCRDRDLARAADRDVLGWCRLYLPSRENLNLARLGLVMPRRVLDVTRIPPGVSLACGRAPGMTGDRRSGHADDPDRQP